MTEFEDFEMKPELARDLDRRLALRQDQALAEPIFNFSYRKIGGLHFFKLGRFGITLYLSQRS